MVGGPTYASAGRFYSQTKARLLAGRLANIPNVMKRILDQNRHECRFAFSPN
jgi:hypothetical protein